VEGKRLGAAFDGDISRFGEHSTQQRSDVGRPSLQRVGGLAEVVTEEEVADFIVEGIVDAALTLKGVAFG